MPIISGIAATGQVREIEKMKQYFRSIVFFHSSEEYPKETSDSK